MSTAIATMDEMTKMAGALVKSKLFGFETIEQAMSIMLIAQAEGRSPALAARDYHVIKGRPALKADAMLARFQQEGGVVEWDEYTETKVTGRFSHPKSCPKPVGVSWSIEMAKRIGLATRDNWRNYPRAMLRARVISEGVRTAYPGIAVGLYSVEEVTDMQKEKDITPTAGAGDYLTPTRREEIGQLADKMREWLNQGSLTDAYGEIDNAQLDTDEQIFLWTHFDSRIRRQLKEEGERQRIKAGAKAIESKITDAQRRRLEARISEAKLDRERIKQMCVGKFGKEHFADLTKSEYDTLGLEIDDIVLDGQSSLAPPQTQADAPTEPAPVVAQNGAGADIEAHITADEALALEARCDENKIAPARVKAAFGVERFSMMTPQQLVEAHHEIDVTLEKRKAKSEIDKLAQK